MYYKAFQHYSDLLKALSHPKRLEIIHLLRGKEFSVNEIREMLDVPQANLSQHLQVLRELRVVETRKNGKQVYYRLAHKNFIKAGDLLRQALVDQYEDDPLKGEFERKISELVPLVTDPVCKMRISAKTASFSKTYKGENYYFCASGCYEKFNKNPQMYKKGRR